MKICYKCKIEKEDSEFTLKSSKKDSLQSECKNCQNQYSREWYSRNRESSKLRTSLNKKKQVAKFKEFISIYKESKPCSDCGNFFPAICMDFDHLRDKKLAIARMREHSLEEVQKEIEKCELVCSNCHRIRTQSRRLGGSS